MKKVLFSNKGIVKGVNLLCDTLKITLGACGHNVVIDSEYGVPIITNDGYTISEAFNLKDKEMAAGAEIAKGAISKTNDDAGDGRTTCAVLLQAILNGGLDFLENTIGADAIQLRKEIGDARDEVVSLIEKDKRECTDTFEVARISAKDDQIGRMIADIFDKIGKDGVVKLEDSDTDEDEISIVEGVELDSGFDPMTLEDVDVILVNGPIKSIPDLKMILDPLVVKGRVNFLVVADEYDPSVTKWLKFSNNDTGIKVIAITSPGFAKTRNEYYEDIAAIIGEAKIAPEVTTDEERTILIGLNTKERAKELEKLKPTSDWDKEQLEKRIANLRGSVALVKVGAKTQVEQIEKRHHLKDAVKAVQSALEEGIVKGGGLAFIKASEKMSTETQGAKILQKAIQAPFEQINTNGFKFTNTDVVDSFKVTRATLENAVSVATSLMTTGAVMVEEEE